MEGFCIKLWIIIFKKYVKGGSDIIYNLINVDIGNNLIFLKFILNNVFVVLFIFNGIVFLFFYRKYL